MAGWWQLGLVLLLAGMVAACCSPTRPQPAAAPPRPLSENVREADLVVVGRVLGLTQPEAADPQRKLLLAHWIQVERTLKGEEARGQRLAARPNGQPWQDGQAYVLFLKTSDGNWVDPLPQPVLPATPANVAAVEREVTAQGAGVVPRPLLRVRSRGGSAGGLLQEFVLHPDGRFAWHEHSPAGGEGPPTRLAGRLPRGAVQRLLRSVAAAGPAPLADDAGTVSFRWLDEQGETRFRVYSQPGPNPGSDMLETIQTLVRRHGRKPGSSSR
jgi:hypothetical protein